MNKISFLDELMKLGGVRIVVKTANELTSDPPAGLMSAEGVPETMVNHPAEASSRLPLTSGMPAQIGQGGLGEVSQAKAPIDQHKFNRGYRESVS